VRATLDTSEGDVLHVATHASLSGGVAALRFADGMLGADEIALHRTSPRLVVLAACESGIAGDDDQLGALSSAFLIAGARHVVATVKPVADEGAAALMRGFYEHGGTDHPVAALAAAQQDAAAAGSHPDWAFFAVYQRAEPCPRPGEGRSKP